MQQYIMCTANSTKLFITILFLAVDWLIQVLHRRCQLDLREQRKTCSRAYEEMNTEQENAHTQAFQSICAQQILQAAVWVRPALCVCVCVRVLRRTLNGVRFCCCCGWFYGNFFGRVNECTRNAAASGVSLPSAHNRPSIRHRNQYKINNEKQNLNWTSVHKI